MSRRLIRRLPPAARWLGTALLALACTAAPAHEGTDQALPAQPGLRLGAALVAGMADAGDAWPALRLPGIFSNGATPSDRRKPHLEHATLEAGLRVNRWLAAAVAWGWHDADPPHLEAAWLQLKAPLGDDGWALGLGRNRLPMGRVIEGGGHFDRFAAMPLAKRAVLGGDWIDDGLSLRWDRSHDGPLPWLETLDLGVWRGRVYPGGAAGPAVPALHASVKLGDWRLDGFAAALRPRGRGAHTQGPNTVHTHARPDCSGALTGITCFDGRSEVLGGSLAADLPWAGLQLRAGGLLRRDRGLLYSANGEAQYRGSTGGGWVDLLWPLMPKAELALRAENLRGVQTLAGSSALLAARDAGLLGSVPLRRASAALALQVMPDVRLSVEFGGEQQGQEHNDFTALRVVWIPQSLWSRSW